MAKSAPMPDPVALLKKLVHPVRIVVLPDKSKALEPPGLRPTDIIVRDGVATHPSSSAKAFSRADTHDEKHIADDPTVVRLSVKQQDFILWYSDRPFSIVDIKPISAYPDARKTYAGPNNPFHRDLPFGDNNFFVVSGPIKSSARNGLFKITLRVEGRLYDPHIATAS